MAPVTATARRRPGARIDPIAAGWGGLAGGVGLMVGSPRDVVQRVLVVAVASLASGFLAGVRAIGRRMAHAMAAWVVAVALLVAFVVVTAAVAVVAGPDGVDPAPGGWRTTAAVLAMSLALTLAGGAVANSWLRPAGQGGR